MDRRAGGFTLIEVTVALAVMALTSAVLYESFGWSLRSGSLLRARQNAWMTAESLLTEIRGARSIAAGYRVGQSAAGNSWRIDIENHEVDLEENTGMRAYRVVVVVNWDTSTARSTRLESIELGYGSL